MPRQLGYVQMANLAAAVGLQDIPEGATLAEVFVEGAAIRYRDDGPAPTAAAGMGPIQPGSKLSFRSTEIADVKLIGVTAGAKLNVAYYAV